MASSSIRIGFVSLLCLLFAGTAFGSPYSGTFEGDGLRMEIRVSGTGYEGTITLGEKEFPFLARQQGDALGGSFRSGSDEYPFTARLAGDRLTFQTGTTTYSLTRKSGGNPLDPGGPSNPLEPRNPLEPDQPVQPPTPPRPEPPRPVAGGKLVDHPAGMKVLVPEGWQSQVQGQGLSLLLPGPQQGARPRMMISVFLYTVPPATDIADPQIQGQMKQNLEGGGWVLLGQLVPSNRNGRRMVTVDTKHKDPNVGLFGRDSLIQLAPGKLVEMFAVGTQAELAGQTRTLASIIDSLKLGEGSPRLPQPPANASGWSGRWVTEGAALALMEQNGYLRGELQQGGASPGLLEARVGPDGTSFSGTLRRGSLALPCGGRLSGAVLELKVGTINPMTGQPVPGKETVTKFTKQGGVEPTPPQPQPVPQPQPQPQPPAGSGLDGRWVGEDMIIVIKGNRLSISYPDDPGEVESGTIRIEGNKLIYTLDGESEALTYHLSGNLLILMWTDGSREVYQRAR